MWRECRQLVEAKNINRSLSCLGPFASPSGTAEAPPVEATCCACEMEHAADNAIRTRGDKGLHRTA